MAARLVGEWSEYLNGNRGEDLKGGDTGGKVQEEGSAGGRFGIEEACEACSLEVRWQTGRWGEVEDTHDVEREDLRRQFGSVVLAVSGTGRGRRVEG